MVKDWRTLRSAGDLSQSTVLLREWSQIGLSQTVQFVRCVDFRATPCRQPSAARLTPPIGCVRIGAVAFVVSSMGFEPMTP